MAGAPVPDRPNIHSNRVPAPKPLKYACLLGLQDNPEGIRVNGPRRAEITPYFWVHPEDER